MKLSCISKSDSNLLNFAAPVITDHLFLFCYNIISFQLTSACGLCILMSIPRPSKSLPCMAPTISRILEWCILLEFSQFSCT